MEESELFEIGSSSTATRFGGLYEAEWLKDLTGPRALAVYREMRDNDAVIGAFLFAIEMLVRQVEWSFVPSNDSAEAINITEFVESCIYDLNLSWQDVLSQVLSMLVYGFSYFEIVYKVRQGPEAESSQYRSRYSDGRIGWRKWAYRDPSTILRWHFDKEGGLQGITQYTGAGTVFIPIEKSLLFRLKTDIPEGRSLLRNAYRSWYLKKNLEELEAIGVERDLAGLPVLWLPLNLLNPKTGEEVRALETWKKLLSDIRRDEKEGVLMPLVYDAKGNKLYDITLLSGPGTSINTTEIIQRYEQRIAMSVMADFLLLGQTGTGSYALSLNKSSLFCRAINTILDSICDTINSYGIPRLLKINGFNTGLSPEISHSNVEGVNLTELADFIAKLAGSGMALFPDPELETYLKAKAGLPSES